MPERMLSPERDILQTPFEDDVNSSFFHLLLEKFPLLSV